MGMEVSNFSEGLRILRKHFGKDGYYMDDFYNLVYSYQAYTRLSSEDAQKMFSLGWFQEGRINNTYDPRNSWNAIV